MTSTMTKFKFNFGDTVISKKTGLPMSGTVIGMAGPEMGQYSTQSFPRWDELYPSWKDKSIYYIKYKTPQKQCTFEEFCNGMQQYYGFIEMQDLEEKYKELPPINIVSFPEDDLELL